MMKMVRMVEMVVAYGDDNVIEDCTYLCSKCINSLTPHPNFVK